MPYQFQRFWKSLNSGSNRWHRKHPRLEIETLEGRLVPTLLFTPHFGQETLSYNGGDLLSSPDVHLIFLGAEWQTAANSQLASDIQTRAATLLSGPYLSGLKQYSVSGQPIDGHAQLGKVVFDTFVNFSTSKPANIFTDQQLQDAINHQVDISALPESDDTSHPPIYVVLTPPGVKSNENPNFAGYHSSFVHSDFFFDRDTMYYAWVSGGSIGSLDEYTRLFSHEIAETVVDPESGWTSTQPGFPTKDGNTEIGDWEAEGRFGYVDRVDGVLAQAYYSAADQGFIIPDGNQQKIALT
jgi:hypothetical protein